MVVSQGSSESSLVLVPSLAGLGSSGRAGCCCYCLYCAHASGSGADGICGRPRSSMFHAGNGGVVGEKGAGLDVGACRRR